MTPAPRRLLPLVALTLLILIAPLLALLYTIPWAQLPELLTTPASRSALTLSLSTATIATLLTAALGIPTCLWLRPTTRLTRAVTTLIYAPMVLSPVVTGLALLLMWRHLAFTPAAVVMVQVVVSLPFFIATTLTSMRAIPTSILESAATEGAGALTIARRIIIPLTTPGIAAGAALSFARALSEYGATITFAGNVAGETRTIPLLVALNLQSGDTTEALAAAALLAGIYLLIGVAFLLLYHRKHDV